MAPQMGPGTAVSAPQGLSSLPGFATVGSVNEPTRVVVVGGGISGLAAAAALTEADPRLAVTVLEGSPEVGGKLALGEVAGITVDIGAEAMLNRRPEGIALADRAGLTPDIRYPATVAPTCCRAAPCGPCRRR